MYVTFADPVTTYRQETLFEIGCRNADGQINPTAVTGKIWDEFTDLSVIRVLDGAPMKYYGNWTTQNIETHSLLEEGDGQCTSWVKLFLDIRKAQGIDNRSDFAVITPGFSGIASNVSGGFLINTWTYTESGASGFSTFPYFNIPGSPFIGSNSYLWKYSDVNYTSGMWGQGPVTMPQSLFSTHVLAQINGMLYDPSYGKTYANIMDFKNGAIGGFYLDSGRDLDETQIGLDLNGDGDSTDTSVPTELILIQKGSGGFNLNLQHADY